jgi:hypothetical protein
MIHIYAIKFKIIILYNHLVFNHLKIKKRSKNNLFQEDKFLFCNFLIPI